MKGVSAEPEPTNKPKVLPPVYFFASIVLMVALHYLFPVARWLPSPWNLAGVLPILGGIVLIRTVISFSLNWEMSRDELQKKPV